MIYPVVLCGGSGTRLWPSSRRAFPKQFAALAGKQSLFQKALARLGGPEFGAPILVTNDDFRFLVEEQAAALGLLDARILLEPAMRNTAPGGADRGADAAGSARGADAGGPLGSHDP